MRSFKLMIIALLAIWGLTACEKECNHDSIEVDYSKDIVGCFSLRETSRILPE